MFMPSMISAASLVPIPGPQAWKVLPWAALYTRLIDSPLYYTIIQSQSTSYAPIHDLMGGMRSSSSVVSGIVVRRTSYQLINPCLMHSATTSGHSSPRKLTFSPINDLLTRMPIQCTTRAFLLIRANRAKQPHLATYEPVSR